MTMVMAVGVAMGITLRGPTTSRPMVMVAHIGRGFVAVDHEQGAVGVGLCVHVL